MQIDRTPAATPRVARLSSAVPSGRAREPRELRVDWSTTVEQYARLWIEEYQGRTSRGIDPSTRHDYRRSLELHVLPALGELPLAHVTPRDIRGVIMSWSVPRTPPRASGSTSPPSARCSPPQSKTG